MIALTHCAVNISDDPLMDYYNLIIKKSVSCSLVRLDARDVQQVEVLLADVLLCRFQVGGTLVH